MMSSMLSAARVGRTLIVRDRGDYLKLLTALLARPAGAARLSRIHQRLGRAVLTAPLFDVARSVRTTPSPLHAVSSGLLSALCSPPPSSMVALPWSPLPWSLLTAPLLHGRPFCAHHPIPSSRCAHRAVLTAPLFRPVHTIPLFALAPRPLSTHCAWPPAVRTTPCAPPYCAHHLVSSQLCSPPRPLSIL